MIPDLRGLPLTRARVLLASLGLEFRPTGSGVVIRQKPAAGQLAPVGTEINAKLLRFTEIAAASASGGEL